MTATRTLLLAGAVLLGATSAYADDDTREVQQGIYDVIRGEPQALQEGRSATATAAPAAAAERTVEANQDPFYFRKATQSNDN